MYRWSFFKDEHVSFKFLSFILFVKLIACFAYYWIYFVYYPSGQNGDSVSTMHDAKVIYNALPQKPEDYFKIIFGLHSESESDPLYQSYFKQIQKWGRADVTSDFFLNDNRTPTRLNAIIMLFSFGHYAVHALVMLIISFLGQFAFYKAFKPFFKGKELILAIIIFFSPSVLFWSSGVLKEPIALFLMGVFIYHFMIFFVNKQTNFTAILMMLVCSLLFLILKPYIFILILLPLILFAIIHSKQYKRIGLIYTCTLFISIVSGILILKTIFKKDVINTIVVRENDFVSLSRGGIFFDNDSLYLRLEHADSTTYQLVDSANQLYAMKPHAKLMYWHLTNLKDTIFVNDNMDTTTLYKLLWINAPAGSAITMRRLENTFSSIASFIPIAFYHVLCKPFFYDSRSVMEHLASFENLIFLAFFMWCFWKADFKKVDKNLLWLCISIVVMGFVLVGMTTTVMGAIVRYKIPFIPFLLMIPLLYLRNEKLKNIPILKRFFADKA
jgi:hypothetical protein